MTQHCFIPVLGKRLRITTLDTCGNPPQSGAIDATLTTDGFITITLTAEVEDGTEIITKKASGALCVNEKQDNSFKRFTVEIEFCGVNPALLAMVSNANPYADYAGDTAGFTVPEGAITGRFALELWTGMSGQACAPGADEASGYVLLPYVAAGVLGDITVDGENAVTFSVTGASTKGGNTWGTGPYNVVKNTDGDPAGLPTPLDPLDHLLLIDTALAPPPDACDPAPMPTPPTPPTLTGVTAGTPGNFTPTGAQTPATLAALKADPVVGDTGSAKPTTAWTTGQYVILGDTTQAHWSGTTWTTGPA